MPSQSFLVRGERSVHVRTLKDSLTLSSGANAAGDFKLKPMLIYHLKIPGHVRIMPNLLWLSSIDGTEKPL